MRKAVEILPGTAGARETGDTNDLSTTVTVEVYEMTDPAAAFGITAREADRWKRDPVLDLARALERRLEGGGMKPDLAEFMSDADPTYQGIVYLRGGLGLSNTWTIWYGNVVGLKEGVTGRSGSGNSLIVRYANSEECARALDSALTELTGPQGFALVSKADRDVVLHDKQGATVVFVQAGRVLLVSGARSEEEARRCIGALQNKVSRLQ
jgi:hypothetical protein